MGAPDDEGDVEELDASILDDSEDSAVAPSPVKPLDDLRARLNLKPPPKQDLFSEASAVSKPPSTTSGGGLFGNGSAPKATGTPPAPTPTPTPSATMAISEDDGWFDDADAAAALDKLPAVDNHTSPGIIPVGRVPAKATRSSDKHDTTTSLTDDDSAIVATGAAPPPPPRSVAADAAAAAAALDALDTSSRISVPRSATADERAALDALAALDLSSPRTPVRPATSPPIAVPRTLTPVPPMPAPKPPATPRAAPTVDVRLDLDDDDAPVAIVSPALPRTKTGEKAPPPVVLTPDERLQAEATALAAEFPTRAAMLHAYRAFVLDDGAAFAQAAKLAPDARFVAFTRRWRAAQAGDAKQLAEAVRAELPLAGEANERAALLWQIANNDEATLRQIVELDPQDLGAWLALALLAMRAKQYPVAAEAFEAAGTKTEDTVARAVFLGSAGALRESHCADDAGARSAYDRAFEANPENPGVASSLEMFALRTGATSDHVRMVALEARRVGDLDPGLGYHERAGDLYWEASLDGVNAAQCYEHAAALATTDVIALGKLAALYEQEARHIPLATVYESLLERIAEPVRKGAVLLRLGGLYESRLDRPMDALRCYQAALTAVPTLAPAAQALARLHQSRQRWGEAAMVLMVEVDRLDNAQARAARYLAIAEMLEANLGTIPQVVKLYERALQLDAGLTAALDALDRFYRANGRWNDLIALYETQLEHATHPARIRADRIALAALYHERAAAPEKAAKQLEQALASAPDHLFVQVGLARALADAGKWVEHIAVLEQQAKLLGEGPELVATLYRIASVADVRIGDPVRAIDAYKRVLAKSPKHELAAQALLRLHSAQARWEDAIAAEELLLGLVERGEEAAVILHRIAHVAEEHLARPAQAIAAYEKALQHLPTYRPARVALERLLRGEGEYVRLAVLLEEQAAGASGVDRARLLCGAALVREMHVDAKSAAKQYTEALAADPGMAGALWGQLRLHVKAGAWKQASETLAGICAQAKHGKPRARLMVQLVRLLELRLGDVERAAVLAEQAFVSDADPSIILERLRIAMARSEADALMWLEEAARITTDSRLASALLRVRAATIEPAGDREATAEAFAIALQHGSIPAVVEGLARNRTGPALGEALSIRAAQVKDPSTRALLYTVAGFLHEQPDASAAAYSAALAASPGLFPALEGHRRLAMRGKDLRGAATICAEMAAVAVDPRNRVELFEEAAALCEKLGDDVQAIGHYREVLAVEPGRPETLDRAISLFERQGEWTLAAQLIGDQISSVGDAKRADLLARRARILAERLGDSTGAIADLDRALTLRPDAPELLSLVASLHESLQQWADAARAYELLARGRDPETKCRALLAQARIWTVEVPDYARAQRFLEEAVTIDPDDRGIAARLAEVTSLAGDTQRAAELYHSLATRGQPVDRVEALLAFADLEKRNGKGDAIEALAPAFDLAFDDVEVVRLLEGYYRLNDKLDRYLVHAEASVMRARPSGRWQDTGPLRVSVGKIYARRDTTAPPNAAPFLEAAVEDAPDDVRLRVTLASSYARTNDAAAIRELRIALEKEPTDPLAMQRLVEATARTGRELAAAVLATAVSLLEGDERPGIVLPNPVPGALGPEVALEQFVGATRAPDVRRVALHVDPHLGPVFGEKEKLDGAVALPETYPLAGTVRGIAAALGVSELALYWREQREPVVLAALDPPALIFSARQVKEDATRARFDLGYMLARVAGGSKVGQIAPLDQVTAMLVAITDGDDPYDFKKRVNSALPRRLRKELEKMVPELDGVSASAIRLWDAEERRRALACGLIASCDLRSVAAALCPEALAVRGEERRTKLRASPMMAEALRLATSESCWAAIARFYGRP